MSLLRYTIRRLWQSAIVLFGVATLTFVLVNTAPGNPIEIMLGPQASPEQVAAMRHRFGLDQPIHIRYGKFILNMMQGDLGHSISYDVPVMTKILERLPVTVMLIITSFTFAILLSIPLGVISAIKRNEPFDHTARVVALIGVSTPSFWIGLMLIITFGYHLNVLPPSGLPMPYSDPANVDEATTHLDVVLTSAKHLILPTITLGTLRMAAMTRIERSSMLEVINKEYITLARAYGVPERRIYSSHAFRNAQLPVITIIGLDLTTALGGSVLTEVVFNINGMGRLIIQAINAQDYPLVLGTTVFFSFVFVVGVLITDLAYAYLDPRIRYTDTEA